VFHATAAAPKILRLLPDFWKIFCNLGIKHLRLSYEQFVIRKVNDRNLHRSEIYCYLEILFNLGDI